MGSHRTRIAGALLVGAWLPQRAAGTTDLRLSTAPRTADSVRSPHLAGRVARTAHPVVESRVHGGQSPTLSRHLGRRATAPLRLCDRATPIPPREGIVRLRDWRTASRQPRPAHRETPSPANGPSRPDSAPSGRPALREGHGPDRGST